MAKGRGSTKPTPTWMKVGWFIWEHKGKLLAWLVSSGLTVLDQSRTKFLPIPGEAATRGLVFAAVLSLAAAVLAWIAISGLSTNLAGNRLLVAYGIAMALSLAGMFGSYVQFFDHDHAWKSASLSQEQGLRLLEFPEPFFYGLVFACLTAAVIFGGTVLKNFFDAYDAAHP